MIFLHNKNEFKIIFKYCFSENHVPYELDVSDSKKITLVFSEILEKFKKPPTILVNSAGITRDGFLLKMEESDYDMVQNVNTKVINLFNNNN